MAKTVKPVPVGLYIIFTKDALSVDKDMLHRSHRAVLIYRSSSLPIDSVDFAGNYNKKFVDKVCKKYLLSSMVESCEVNFKYPPPRQLKYTINSKLVLCPPAPQLTKQFKEIEDLLRAVELSDKCGLINKDGLPIKHSGLTPLWSQEYIGSDLSRALVKNYRSASVVKIGNIDSSVSKKHVTGKVIKGFDWSSIDVDDFDDHGTSTLNLLNGKEPIGTSENAVISSMFNIFSDWRKGILPALDEMAESKPDFINLEIHTLCQLSKCKSESSFNRPNSLRRVLKKMSTSSIVVASAGNYFPEGSLKDKSDNLDIIIVGNMNPLGLVTFDSDESQNVNIIAPAGYEQMTYNTKGYDPNWGGTSGATPLVTGVLADAKSILGELSFNEAKTLLERSSTPTSNRLQDPQKNGAGSLNAYKLIKVAIKLKERGWPQNRQKLLAESGMFEFELEATEKVKQAKELFRSDECDDLQKGMRLLRESFLLNFSEESANMLSIIYDKLGYGQNAQYYKNFDKENLKEFLANPIPPNPSFYLVPSARMSIDRAKKQLSL